MGPLVMLDYDGVLADSLHLFEKHFGEACRLNGFGELFQGRNNALALLESNIYEGMVARGLRRNEIDSFLRSYDKLASTDYDASHFPGISEALERISRAASSVIVITSNITAVVEENIARRGDARWIDEVLGADVERSKLKKIERQIASHPEAPAFYVGDTVGDILEGRGAGAITVGAAWGWHGREKLAAASPDHLIDTPEELATLLSKK